MSFAENLRQLRKENGLSQEELAEIMNVSRQAVSKWEQSESYPEVEKLLFLAARFQISLDSLLETGVAEKREGTARQVSGSITISSPHEQAVVTCYKVVTSKKMKGGRNAPQYALFGVGHGGNSFWGEPTTFLGWYANHELLAKEVCEIQQAMMQGIPAYELKYSAKVTRKWMRISVVEESAEA